MQRRTWIGWGLLALPIFLAASPDASAELCFPFDFLNEHADLQLHTVRINGVIQPDAASLPTDALLNSETYSDSGPQTVRLAFGDQILSFEEIP